MSYDATFYDVIRGGIQSSADVVAPLVFDLVRPSSVVDVGCGEGWWAHRFAELGAEDVFGIDGAYVRNHAPGFIFSAQNLEQPIRLSRTFDLAVCLEVAEHLRPARAPGLVDDLRQLAPVVLFSAAIPGQGGTGHINEQWPAYWSALFEDAGFAVSGHLRWHIWEDDRVENWYRQNLLLAVDPLRRPDLAQLVVDVAGAELRYPYPVVHPILYEARRKP